MSDVVKHLGAALEWKYGLVADTRNGEIVGWRSQEPQPTDLAALVQEYLDRPAPPVVEVTPRQARLALLNAGLLDTVETELAKPENKAAQIEWQYANAIRREDDLIATIGGALGLTEQQIDDLFAAAAAL